MDTGTGRLDEAVERLRRARAARDAAWAADDFGRHIEARKADDEYWAAREAVVKAAEAAR